MPARDQPSNGTFGQHRLDQRRALILGERALHPAPSLGEKRRQIDRMPLQLFEKDEQPVIGHPLRVEDPVEVVAFVLDDPGVETLDLALDNLSLGARPAIADAQMARARLRATRGPTGSPPNRARAPIRRARRPG